MCLLSAGRREQEPRKSREGPGVAQEKGAGGTDQGGGGRRGGAVRFWKVLGDPASWFADGLMGCGGGGGRRGCGYSGPDWPWCPQAVCPVGLSCHELWSPMGCGSPVGCESPVNCGPVGCGSPMNYGTLWVVVPCGLWSPMNCGSPWHPCTCRGWDCCLPVSFRP